nr:hypothetical protein [Tanacetum cinerariifolium]
MVAYHSKSDASEGFNQIIDFLNVSSLKYALMVNPNIYVSSIKQFWTTVAVKQLNDVTRLQALVDKKKIVVTEATIRDALHLDDVEGVDCLPNEEIFIELARMGYEKPSTKLTFYKAFFSSQWKFLIHTILQCMSAKRTSWNEFSSSMASAIICLSSGDLSTHTTKYTSPALTQKVFANIRRVGKGFFGVETLLFEAQALEITKLKIRVKKLENRNKVRVLKLRRLQKAQVPTATLTAAPVRVADAPRRRRKGVVIRDPKEESTTSTIIPAETKSKDKVDKKKVVITEATIRDALRLDDAEGVDCLPNEEIFVELARMGYENPSTELTFYKAFFSSQWKFLIHIILQLLSAKRTSWNEFSSAMASAVICLSTGKGFSGVETPLFEGMDDSAAHGEVLTVAKEQSISSPTPPTPPPQPPQDIPSTSQVQQTPSQPPQDIPSTSQEGAETGDRNKVRVLKLRRLQKVGTSQRVETSDDTVMDDESNQGRMIAKMDLDDAIVLEDDKDEDMKIATAVKNVKEVKVDESAQDQGRQEESQAEIYKIEMDHAIKVLSMQEDKTEPAAKLITKVVTATSEIVTAANMEQPNPTFAKIPILDTRKFKQRKFRIQQYLQNEHYALWEVIEFGDFYEAPQEVADIGSVSEGSAKKKGRTVAVTTEDMQKRRNDVKARTTI